MTLSLASASHVPRSDDPDAAFLAPHSPIDSGGDSTPFRTPSPSGSDSEQRQNSPDIEPAKWRSDGGPEPPCREHRESDRADNDLLDSADEADHTVLALDPANMASWTGQPSIKGSTEAMRMVLLTFNAIGIT